MLNSQEVLVPILNAGDRGYKIVQKQKEAPALRGITFQEQKIVNKNK